MIMQLTILTTTYNRASLLTRCYQSLLKQTCKDFEWLVIDDGSTDETRKIIAEIKAAKPPFTIVYIKKENGGKHTAMNYSHSYIRGKYLLMLDDDDMLTPDAVGTILKDWEVYDSNDKIGCISYQRADLKTKKPLVKWNEQKPIISNTIDFRVNARRNGDCAEVIRTSMFLEYPAPVFDKEKFLSEEFLWINSSMKYNTVYILKVIYLCEYQVDGLTRRKYKNLLKNPMGGMYTCNLYFNYHVSWLIRLKKAILYDCYALATNAPIKYLRQSKELLMCFILLPIASLIYIRLK